MAWISINPIKKEIYIEKVFCVHINNNGEFIDLKEIDEILKFMEDNRDDIMIIFAETFFRKTKNRKI